MEYFLERIARALKEEYGSLNRHCLVFPGRRAGLYIIKYLSEGLQKPLWAPATYTINDLISSGTSLQAAGTEILLCELYQVYSGIRKAPESFDDFYFWGDMLLNDFDDADKYLVDTSALFGNIRDLKEIDIRFGNLTDQQKSVIKNFWINFDVSKPTREKDSFINIWSILNDLYTSFRSKLRSRNIAYEGMIFRDVAESADPMTLIAGSWDMIHFIGFNALNACEKKIMLSLKNAGKAKFYWDYDNSYIKKGTYNSAGLFMSENLQLFGNDMPEDWNYNTMLSAPAGKVQRKVIQTSSDIAQVKLIPGMVSEIPGLSNDNSHHTAIVLSDENLLVPVLTSLPDSVQDINITMGYPLRQSQVYTFTKMLMDLQLSAVSSDGITRFPCKLSRALLKHPLLKNIIPEDEKRKGEEITGKASWVSASSFEEMKTCLMLFRKLDDNASLAGWFREILSSVAVAQYKENDGEDDNLRKGFVNEFIYRIVLALNRLETVINTPGMNFSAATYIRIFDRLLRNQSVPFSGEPLSGIQIMGILETRALDFKNIIILSVNEGVMPSLSSSSSFIPFSLREAFGIPSLNHQESIFAYHFYRLLHRAENVTFTYNSNSEGLKSGEMSRFLIQMHYDDRLKPSFLTVGYNFKALTVPGEILKRDDSHSQLLYTRFVTEGRPLSPSAINTWLSCRMKFYFRYVAGIKEPERPAEEIDPATFGTILHEIMRLLYAGYTGKIIGAAQIDSIIKDEDLLRKFAEEAILHKFRKGMDGPVTGNELIVKEILLNFVKRILIADRDAAPLKIFHIEEYFDFPIELRLDGSQVKIRTGGYTDRIDLVKSEIRIVDYKTGTISDSISGIEDLFGDDRKKDHDGWLQVLIYCEAYLRKSAENLTLKPFIYKIKKMSSGSFTGDLIIKREREDIPVSNYIDIREQFMKGLNETITGIFDPDEPFVMTKDTRNKCRYCPYCSLCSR
ncbi:MAG TPA: PD-(D/E)XK nuclease family protein [Bacteroidales bacterium]|nr:PD-(D/E)XK nuclease family protein [Bacteroidales bacterium]